MSITDFGRQLRPREHKSVNHLEKIQELFLVEMKPKELAKYGGKRANILFKAIDDGTPLETDSGTFPLTMPLYIRFAIITITTISIGIKKSFLFLCLVNSGIFSSELISIIWLIS